MNRWRFRLKPVLFAGRNSNSGQTSLALPIAARSVAPLKLKPLLVLHRSALPQVRRTAD